MKLKYIGVGKAGSQRVVTFEELHTGFRFRIWEFSGKLSAGDPWDPVTGKALQRCDMPHYRTAYHQGYKMAGAILKKLDLKRAVRPASAQLSLF